jgi:hypothetical protein
VGGADGARVWARVLSELALVEVRVEWERPAWRVRWVDGPTRQVLMDRAAALGGYRVAAALPVGRLRFTRHDSPVAVALGWLARGSAGSPALARAVVPEVEAFCADTGYPLSRFDDRTVAAAELLSRLGSGDSTVMGELLSRATPPLAPYPPDAAGPELPGRVVSFRWPSGGPPAELLGPTQTPTPAVAGAVTDRPVVCRHCGKPLDTVKAGTGRPARYCGGTCRTAAHRAQRRASQPTTARSVPAI